VGNATSVTIRRELRDGDAGEIVELHRRVYVPEYERNEAFLAAVAASVQSAVTAGWPHDRGAVWLLDRDAGLSGSLALTDEGGGLGHVRWVVFAPELRGLGLGRRVVEEMVREARSLGLRKLELETFGALTTAAHLYRSAGFRVRWERPRDDWGPPIVYQHYELELEPEGPGGGDARSGCAGPDPGVGAPGVEPATSGL
jgi:ribosomal protein S18 acetylase RimI-like enzyme